MPLLEGFVGQLIGGLVPTSNGNSGDLNIVPYSRYTLDLTLTAFAGVAGSITPKIQRKLTNGNYVDVFTFPAFTANGSQSASVGPGMQIGQFVGDFIRVAWTVGGVVNAGSLAIDIQADKGNQGILYVRDWNVWDGKMC